MKIPRLILAIFLLSTFTFCLPSRAEDLSSLQAEQKDSSEIRFGRRAGTEAAIEIKTEQLSPGEKLQILDRWGHGLSNVAAASYYDVVIGELPQFRLSPGLVAQIVERAATALRNFPIGRSANSTSQAEDLFRGLRVLLADPKQISFQDASRLYKGLLSAKILDSYMLRSLLASVEQGEVQSADPSKPNPRFAIVFNLVIGHVLLDADISKDALTYLFQSAVMNSVYSTKASNEKTSERLVLLQKLIARHKLAAPDVPAANLLERRLKIGLAFEKAASPNASYGTQVAAAEQLVDQTPELATVQLFQWMTERRVPIDEQASLIESLLVRLNGLSQERLRWQNIADQDLDIVYPLENIGGYALTNSGLPPQIQAEMLDFVLEKLNRNDQRDSITRSLVVGAVIGFPSQPLASVVLNAQSVLETFAKTVQTGDLSEITEVINFVADCTGRGPEAFKNRPACAEVKDPKEVLRILLQSPVLSAEQRRSAAGHLGPSAKQ